jgi:RimJ/RimL family protein N-acetyltransferase
MSNPVELRDRSIRLRRVELDEYQTLAADWYADAEVLRLSEGGAEPYGPAQIKAMYEALSRQGELYVIDIAGDDGWCTVGDAALLPDAVPIVVGRPEYRSRGVGTAVLQLLIARARELGWTEVRVKAIDPDNIRARRLYERAGFAVVATDSGIALRKTL